MKSFDRLTLVIRVLRAQAEHVGGPCGGQLLIIVSKRAGLRRTTACAWDGIPIFRNRLIRLPHPGKAIDHRTAASLSQFDQGSRSRSERNRGYHQSLEVSTCSVVLRYRQIGRQFQEVAHEAKIRGLWLLRNRAWRLWQNNGTNNCEIIGLFSENADSSRRRTATGPNLGIWVNRASRLADSHCARAELRKGTGLYPRTTVLRANSRDRHALICPWPETWCGAERLFAGRLVRFQEERERSACRKRCVP